MHFFLGALRASYLFIFAVAHLDYLVKKLMKFLNVVCEYEIVGVDKMEGPLTSALSVLNILFTTQIVNKDRHSIQNLCKGR